MCLCNFTGNVKIGILVIECIDMFLYSHTDVNECLLNPCMNNGTCINTDGSFICRCPPGWTGPTCSEDVNECPMFLCKNGASCQNGAECVNTPGSYKCICPPGWTGTNCEIGMCKQTGFYADTNEIYLIDSFQ